MNLTDNESPSSSLINPPQDKQGGSAPSLSEVRGRVFSELDKILADKNNTLIFTTIAAPRWKRVTNNLLLDAKLLVMNDNQSDGVFRQNAGGVTGVDPVVLEKLHVKLKEAILSFGDIAEAGKGEYYAVFSRELNGLKADETATVKRQAKKIKESLEKLQKDLNQDTRVADVFHAFDKNSYREISQEIPVTTFDPRSNKIVVKNTKIKALSKPLEPDEVSAYIDRFVHSTQASAVGSGSQQFGKDVTDYVPKMLKTFHNNVQKLIERPEGDNTSYPHGRIKDERAYDLFDQEIQTAIQGVESVMTHGDFYVKRARATIVQNLRQLQMDMAYSNSLKVTAKIPQTGPAKNIVDPAQDPARTPPRKEDKKIGQSAGEHPFADILRQAGFQTEQASGLVVADAQSFSAQPRTTTVKPSNDRPATSIF